MDLSHSVGPCPHCRSSIYHSTDSGYLVCEYGHQSQNFWTEEQDDFEAHVGKTRRIKGPSQTLAGTEESLTFTPKEEKISDDAEETEILKLGDVERFWLFVALQTVLKAQIEALRNFLNLSEEFDAHVKKIWLLFVTTFGLEYDEEQVDPEGAGDTDNFVDPSVADGVKMPHSTKTEKEELSEILDSEPCLAAEDTSPPFPVPSASPPSSPSNNTPNSQYLHYSGCSFGRYKRTATTMGPRTLLIIVFFGLLEANVPILMADIRRLVLVGVIPYTNTKHLMPEKIRKSPMMKKWTLLLGGQKHAIPVTSLLERLAIRLGSQLAYRASFRVKDPNLPGLLRRFCNELALPYCYIPFIVALVHKYKVPLGYFNQGYPVIASPAPAIMAGVVFFLKTHYSFDTPRKMGQNSLVFWSMGLPNSAELLQVWESRVSRFVDFRKLPHQDSFAWSCLDDYLKYCDGIDLPLKQNIDLKDKPPPPLQTLDFYHITPPVWQNVQLSDEQKDTLRKTPKFWTNSLARDIKNLPREYRILLKLASDVIEMDTNEFAHRMHRFYEIKK